MFVSRVTRVSSSSLPSRARGAPHIRPVATPRTAVRVRHAAPRACIHTATANTASRPLLRFRTFHSAPNQPAEATVPTPATDLNSSKAASAAADGALSYRCPVTGDVQALPRKFRELSNEVLSQMAVQGVFGARKERVIREIMRVDKVEWAVARQKLAAMNEINDQNGWVATLPYKVGVFTGIVGGLVSIPMVFSKDMALWFNENFVGEALPEDGIEEGLATVFKVGNWTWNWMEPPLGTASFVLLGFQMARIHMNNLGWKPYTEWILDRRADRLSAAFPQYESGIVKDYSRSDPWKS